MLCKKEIRRFITFTRYELVRVRPKQGERAMSNFETPLLRNRVHYIVDVNRCNKAYRTSSNLFNKIDRDRNTL